MTDGIIVTELLREAIPYNLLLIADPSKDIIDSYISVSTIYIAKINEQTVGCYVLLEMDEQITEIKNIVVDEKFQGKGIGTMLLKDACDKARMQGYTKLMIGTGNSSFGQLYLYQKVGFRITGIKTDFFTQNYKEPIFENGIECKDLLILAKDLWEERITKRELLQGINRVNNFFPFSILPG